MTEKEELTIEKLLSLQFSEETLKKIIVAAFDKHRKLLEKNRKYKAAFMSLLGDYVSDAKFGNCYNDTFCEVCPLQKHQWGGCSKDLNTDFDYDTCAEEIFKFYVEVSNE